MRYLDKIGIIVILVGVILLVWFGYIFPQLHKTTVDGHECIDLGLPSGTLWATCNLGSETPYEYGDYYAWGRLQQSQHSHGRHTNTVTGKGTQ